MSQEQRDYLVKTGWEQVMTEEDGLETWSYPWDNRKNWPLPYSKSSQHYWDLEEAYQLQREIDGYNLPKGKTMLGLLQGWLTDGTILNLLHDQSKWDSLIVNRRKPHTYRVFTNVGDFRICLHRFDTCDLQESFEHPHPWPGAFTVMEGSYQMKVGYSIDRYGDPIQVADFVMKKGSMYEITNPLTWHAVTPLETTYTIMVNGPAWTPDFAHTKVRTTKGKDLDKMPSVELNAHLNKFITLFGEKMIDEQYHNDY